MNRSKIVCAVLAVILIGACAAGASRAQTDARPEAYAASIYDKLSPELIQIYEREISCAPIVSDKPQALLESTAARLNISVGKLKAIILLQDVAARTGEDVSLSELAALNDIEILIYAKDRATKYANALPPERREQLKSLLLSALRS